MLVSFSKRVHIPSKIAHGHQPKAILLYLTSSGIGKNILVSTLHLETISQPPPINSIQDCILFKSVCRVRFLFKMFDIEACDREKHAAVVEQPSWSSHRGAAVAE